MDKNICRFFPNVYETNEINILNFVYETKECVYSGMTLETVYKMHLVVNGTGKLHTLRAIYNLKDGDVFFTHPSMRYAIESEENFEYMYISYLGLRTKKLMDKLNILNQREVFENLTELKPIWATSISDDKSILNLKCEGILLYSLSILGEHIVENNKDYDNIVLKVKKYIDDNFTDNTLSIRKISNEYSYNQKYLSGVFKKEFGIGMAKYITILRIQYACELMERGYTSVSDIAFQSGYSEALYFSKVFKKIMGISPKEHIISLKNM